MLFYASLPFLFLKFWFFEAPLGLIKYFASLNIAFLQLFSLPLLLRTFFRPWKNEYRKGMVGVARGIGMTIKTFVILVDLILFLLLLSFEMITILSFLLLPLEAVSLLLL